MKRLLAITVTILLIASAIAGCATTAPTAAPQASKAADTQAPAATPAPAEGKPYIAIISKGFQHQFWQTVYAGAKDAAAKYNVEITFEGPASESDVAPQVDMLNAAIAKKPVALALAALDTKSVTQQLNDCKAQNIPVIGFDSGVPGAPAGTIKATAATNNEAAGVLAADKLFEEPGINSAIKAATADKPVVIGCVTQDVTSASLKGRTDGFVNEIVKKCETLQAGNVEVKGHVQYEKAATSGKAAVTIQVLVSQSSNVTDCTTVVQTMLNTQNLIGLFSTNSGTIDGIMASTSDGKDLPTKYPNLKVVGFDAGKTLKAAVRNKWFYGAITQDPYMIGYLSVELAYKAYKGEAVADSDTGCHFYDSTNMDQPDIAKLLYD